MAPHPPFKRLLNVLLHPNCWLQLTLLVARWSAPLECSSGISDLACQCLHRAYPLPFLSVKPGWNLGAFLLFLLVNPLSQPSQSPVFCAYVIKSRMLSLALKALWNLAPAQLFFVTLTRLYWALSCHSSLIHVFLSPSLCLYSSRDLSLLFPTLTRPDSVQMRFFHEVLPTTQTTSNHSLFWIPLEFQQISL